MFRTNVIGGIAYPTRYRSTGHGISAACGKVGALIAAYGFSQVKNTIGLGRTLGILAGFMGLGFINTYFFTPETGNMELGKNVMYNTSYRPSRIHKHTHAQKNSWQT